MSGSSQGQQQMTGVDKAAILLLSLGTETASEIMAQLDQSTVSMLSMQMAKIDRIRRSDRDRVVTDFVEELDGETSHRINSMQALREMLDMTFGEAEAAKYMEMVLRGGTVNETMEIINEADPRVLAEQLLNERPQAIAVVVAQLEPSVGSEFLLCLPEAKAAKVLQCYASLESVQPNAISELSAVLTEQLSGQIGTQQLSNLGGVRNAAALLNNLESSKSENLLKSISDETAENVREHMFTFVDLMSVSDEAIQTLLREVTNDLLVPALKAAPPEIVDRIKANMTQRVSKVLQEELESGPPLRRSEAERAQKEILRTARRLDEEGVITLATDEELL